MWVYMYTATHFTCATCINHTAIHRTMYGVITGQNRNHNYIDTKLRATCIITYGIKRFYNICTIYAISAMYDMYVMYVCMYVRSLLLGNPNFKDQNLLAQVAYVNIK